MDKWININLNLLLTNLTKFFFRKLTAILVIAFINLASSKHCHPKTRIYPIEPPLNHLYPYKPSDKSILEEIQDEPLQSSNQPASFNNSYIPKTFQTNFLDLAKINTGNPKPRGVLSVEERAFQNLATVTNTHRECYQAVPANISDLSPVCMPLFMQNLLILKI